MTANLSQLSTIARLKRLGKLSEALLVATECMNSMRESATRDPRYVEERFVLEVALLHRKFGNFQAEAATVESWLELDLPAPQPEVRLALKKRLAKAREELARKRLRSPSRLLPLPDELLEPDFVAVDFETANRRGGVSACQVALVRVRAGQVVDQKTSLLRPPPGWDHFEFTYLHGISASHTRTAPAWEEIAGDISQFIGDSPVYAHNATFDSKVWADLDHFFSQRSMPERFFCTYRIARRTLPGLPNYKLPTVTAACAPEFTLKHHDAGSDAEACALIVASLQKNERALAALGNRTLER